MILFNRGNKPLIEFSVPGLWKTGIVLAVLSLSTACFAPQSQPIEWGKEDCAECKMTHTDRRFGVERVTKKGKVYKYDSYECFLEDQSKNQSDTAQVYVVDAASSGKGMIPVESAKFMSVPGLRSPMGEGMIAATQESDLRKFSATAPILNWNQVLEHFKKATP